FARTRYRLPARSAVPVPRFSLPTLLPPGETKLLSVAVCRGWMQITQFELRRWAERFQPLRSDRNWMILRRSRFEGLPAGAGEKFIVALRSSRTFWRSSRLASVSR